MNKISLLLIILGVLTNTKGFGQQQANFSLSNQFMGIYNPSSIPDEYTYYHQNIIVGANVKRQWTNLVSAPQTQTIRGEFITTSDNTFNLLTGIHIINDQAGPITTTGLYVRLAGIMSNYDPQVGGFSAGIQIGMVQQAIRTNSLQEKYPTDILTIEDKKATKPQIGAGISYYNNFENDLALNTGISITQITGSDYSFKGNSLSYNYKSQMHYYAYGKIRKYIFEEQAIELDTRIRYVNNTPLNFDVQLLGFITEFLSIEIGSNSSGIGHGGVGLYLFDIFGMDNNLMSITYSFNPSLINAGTAFGNTHEININYSFK